MLKSLATFSDVAPSEEKVRMVRFYIRPSMGTLPLILLTHWQHAVLRIITGVHNLVHEGSVETFIPFAQGLGAHRYANCDGSSFNLVGDMLCGRQAGRAKAGDARSSSSVRKASCERSCTGVVCSFAVANLYAQISTGRNYSSYVYILTFPRQTSSIRDGSMLLLCRTCSRILKTRLSRVVSLRPPFPDLHIGVRIASVITTSSGVCCVLAPPKELDSCPK